MMRQSKMAADYNVNLLRFNSGSLLRYGIIPDWAHKMMIRGDQPRYASRLVTLDNPVSMQRMFFVTASNCSQFGYFPSFRRS